MLLLMNITREAEVQLNRVVLRLMSTMLTTTPLHFDADGTPVAEGHVGEVVLRDFPEDLVLLETSVLFCWTCFHVAVLDGDVAGEDARQL